jgi:hypothetical protein
MFAIGGVALVTREYRRCPLLGLLDDAEHKIIVG